MLILREVLGGVCANVPGYGQIVNFNFGDMKVEKENYLVINGVRYDPVKSEHECEGCCFFAAGECNMQKPDGFSIFCDDPFVFANKGEVAVDAAAEQRPTERSEKEMVEDGKAKKTGSIGKRSYYGFPNGVEAEDICRYLSFNLGNVVKYACRAGRKDAKKKIEDLMKARDYLDNEIKRLEEGDE